MLAKHLETHNYSILSLKLSEKIDDCASSPRNFAIQLTSSPIGRTSLNAARRPHRDNQDNIVILKYSADRLIAVNSSAATGGCLNNSSSQYKMMIKIKKEARAEEPTNFSRSPPELCSKTLKFRQEFLNIRNIRVDPQPSSMRNISTKPRCSLLVRILRHSKSQTSPEQHRDGPSFRSPVGL